MISAVGLIFFLIRVDSKDIMMVKYKDNRTLTSVHYVVL